MSDIKKQEPLHLNIDLNVLNHLGIGLYTNTPAVLTEIIANGWDADASEIRIDIDEENNEIIISDCGIGMDHKDLQDKFLTVGYARREHGEETTASGRQCMGRKGIGKLAMFSLAEEVHLVSRKEGSVPQGFVINVSELSNRIKSNQSYSPEPIEDTTDYTMFDTGTTIVLKRINRSINRTESFLRRRIARRFSVIGDKHGFKVFLNGVEVTIKDRGFYPDIQLLWTFGDNESETKELCTNFKRHHHFTGEIQNTGYKINGFIAGVEKPSQLTKDGDNNNTITLVANGRIFDEDVKKRLDDAKVFNSYLVGELQVDFFDTNEDKDMAVSSRQGVVETDARFSVFIDNLKNHLSAIADQWDLWRRELGADKVVSEFPTLNAWFQTLGPKHEKKARQLVSKLNTMRFSGSDIDQTQQKREILKHQVLAFEKLRLKDNLESIEAVNIENDIEKFSDILLSIEDIEATMHYEIIQQRIAVVRKLERYNSDGVRERVVQEHIYNNMWLVDPSLERTDEPTEIEVTLTKYLKAACPDTDEGARIDLGYRTVSGKYIVLELKRPGLPVQFEKLHSQGAKYRKALRQYFSDNPGSCPVHGQVPAIEIIFIVDKRPKDMGEDPVYYEGALRNINAMIITYTDLINQALKSYDDYLKASKKVSRIKEIVESI